jgi:hypothetical protein
MNPEASNTVEQDAEGQSRRAVLGLGVAAAAAPPLPAPDTGRSRDRAAGPRINAPPITYWNANTPR